MTQGEMDDIIAINKDKMPVMKIGNVTTGMDTQERVNGYWKGLADKYGFKQMTVEGSSKGHLFFLAEPKPIVKPKTQTQIEIDKYLPLQNGYLNIEVRESLNKIITQLEKYDYQSEGGPLKNNVAFLALDQLAGKSIEQDSNK